MQNSFDTSFIPQQPLLKVEGFERTKETLNLPLLLALVTFFVVLTVGGGVYFYHQKVLNVVHDLSADLQNREKSLDIDEINRFKEVDLRIAAAKNLLHKHTVFTAILNFLEAGTIHNVGLTSLSYTNEAEAILNVAAVAPSYEAVYFQGETWRAMKPLVASVDISSVMLAEGSGVVSFRAKVTLNPELVRYAQLLKDMEQRAVSASSTAAEIPVSANPQTP